MKPFRLSFLFRILQTGHVRAATILTAVAGLWFFPLASSAEEKPREKMAKAMEHQKAIYVMLAAWAQDHDAAFPDEPLDANANFRVLFRARLLDNEKIFGIPGDGWCQEGKPDGEIGDAPDFSKALEPGELSIAYVAGHNAASSSLSPLMISGAGAATAWIMGVGPKPAGAVFRGPVVVTFVNRSTQLRIPDEEGKICWQRGDRKVDIFSAENGIKPENIRLPAPVKPKE